MSASIGNRPPRVDPLPALFDPAMARIPVDLREVAGEAIVVIDQMQRSPASAERGVTTYEIGARMRLRSRSPRRQALNDALTWLRTGGLLRYTVWHEVTWHITDGGREVAARLRPPVAGHAERAIGQH